MGFAGEPVTVASGRLLLRAALDKPDHAVRCFAEWWDHVEIEHIGATEYRLLPLVYNNIGRLIPDKVAAALVKGVAKHAWLLRYKNASLATHALDTLISANVPTLILKGSAMMLAITGENTRLADDCDFLVPAERAPEALGALSEIGFHSPHDYDVGHFTTYDFKELHALPLRQVGEQAYHLDIHWRPLHNVRADELTGEFFDQSVPCIFSGRATRRPCLEHMLLHSAVHGTGWAAVSRYDWLANSVLILRKAGSRFDWDRLAGTAKRYGLAAIINSALNELIQTFDIRVPSSALRRLSRHHAIDRAEARWRSVDPIHVPAFGQYVMALQKLRREDMRLANYPVWAILSALWRYLLAPLPSALMCQTMGVDGDDHVIFLGGWSYKETNGRWTDGPLAMFAIQRPPGRRGNFLQLTGHAFQADPHKPQVIDVCVGWWRIARLAWKATAAPVTHVIPLPPALSKRKVLRVLLHIRRPHIGTGPDQRRLGLYLQDIRTISLCVRDAAKAASI